MGGVLAHTPLPCHWGVPNFSPPHPALSPRLTRQFPSSSARRMMVPHFFPGMPLPGGAVRPGEGVFPLFLPRAPQNSPIGEGWRGSPAPGVCGDCPHPAGTHSKGRWRGPPPKKPATPPIPPQHGETEAGAGGGTRGAQSCRHWGLGSIPDTQIRTWASRQRWEQQGGHMGTPGSQPSAGPLQGKLRHRAEWELTSGASPGGCQLSPQSRPGCRRPGPGSPMEPLCHRGYHRDCHCPQWMGGNSGPHLRAWRDQGSWSPHRTWGQSRGHLAKAAGTGMGIRWPWGHRSDWDRDGDRVG